MTSQNDLDLLMVKSTLHTPNTQKFTFWSFSLYRQPLYQDTCITRFDTF